MMQWSGAGLWDSGRLGSSLNRSLLLCEQEEMWSLLFFELLPLPLAQVMDVRVEESHIYGASSPGWAAGEGWVDMSPERWI